MADAIVLTRLPVRVTVSGATMSLAEAIDVGKYGMAVPGGACSSSSTPRRR